MGFWGRSICTVHSISAQTSQEGIKCTKAKEQLRSYSPNNIFVPPTWLFRFSVFPPTRLLGPTLLLDFRNFFPPTLLLGPTRLLNFRIFSHQHCYLDSTVIRHPRVGTCFRFYTQMWLENKTKHLHIEFIVTSHNSV